TGGQCEESSAGTMLFFTWRPATGCVVVSTATACMTRLTNNPLCNHSIDFVFSARHCACERTFVGRRLNFRHAGTHSSPAVRSAKLGKNSRCILREVFYVNTSAAVKRGRSTHPTLGAQRSPCGSLCAPNA